MCAIETAKEMNWKNIWIEGDSQLVVRATNQNIQVSWCLEVELQNYKLIARSLNCLYTHIHSCIGKEWKKFALFCFTVLEQPT